MIYIFLPYTPFEPVGGVRTLFDYALRINTRAGKTLAVVLSDSQYMHAWLPHGYQKVRVRPTSTKIHDTDTLVFPEVMVEEAQAYPTVHRKILAVLNWQYFQEHMKTHNLEQLGYSSVITNSKYAEKKITPYCAGLPALHIPHYIDTQTYVSQLPVTQRPQHSVFMLNRKNSNHLPAILQYLRTIAHTATLLNNIHPDRMPEHYRKHQIFINLGYPEGFCRPAAEAMASECIVVGFTGGGASDFMIDGKTALVAEDGNEEQLIRQLNHAIHMSASEKSVMTRAAREYIVTHYKKENQAEYIAQVFSEEIAVCTMNNKAIHRHPPTLKKTSQKRHKRVEPREDAVAVLHYQLFEERRKHQEVVNSKFFKVWQWYCKRKVAIRRFASAALPKNILIRI